MNRYILLLSAILLICGCGKRDEQSLAGKQIHFNYMNAVENFDIGTLTDSSFRIIPLETTENSLIARIDKIEIRNSTVYIKDGLAKAVFIYGMDGKFHNRIRAVGQGPGEYSHISYMTVTDSSVIILDHYTGKQLEYRLPDLKFMRENRIPEEIWATEVFTLPGMICYYNGYGTSGSNKYLLFTGKTGDKDYGRHLKFDETPLSLGINGPEYAVNGNEASMIFSGNSMIYRISSSGKAFPEYEMVFENERVAYSSGKVENVFQDNPPGRILNMNAINESDRYLFIDVAVTVDCNKPIQPGNYDNYTCLYDKADSSSVIYPHSAVNSNIDSDYVTVRRIINNRIIDWREADILLMQAKYLYAKKTFSNKAYEKCLKEVISNLKEDDNPVLFIFSLKHDVQ